mmetsp:Transcript_16792/g.26194  ORF Transcript_16792/g.26194 Transcript_16792/m.26194 type:complete len:200 (-) Transcript_16792:945-1544(-)
MYCYPKPLATKPSSLQYPEAAVSQIFELRCVHGIACNNVNSDPVHALLWQRPLCQSYWGQTYYICSNHPYSHHAQPNLPYKSSKTHTYTAGNSCGCSPDFSQSYWNTSDTTLYSPRSSWQSHSHSYISHAIASGPYTWLEHVAPHHNSNRSVLRNHTIQPSHRGKRHSTQPYYTQPPDTSAYVHSVLQSIVTGILCIYS